jgi:diguanylate cyclase (GGDEF)-like protein
MIIVIVGIYRKDFSMKGIKKIVRFLGLPIALIIVTGILFLNKPSLPKSLVLVLPYIAYAFYIIGIILGVRFNKSRVFFLCLILGIAQFSLSGGSSIFRSATRQADISDIISFLIPINILLFSITRERGILTLWGRVKFGAVIIQALLVRLLIDPPNHDLRALISHKIINAGFLNSINMPQISMLLYFAVLVVLCVRLYSNPTLINSTLVGVVLLTFIGILTRAYAVGLSLFFAAAGLLLVISLLEISYNMAYRDELTGLPSRRSLEESMLKLGSKYSIAMLDIDFFKKFNDTYGHNIGDKVLQRVAMYLMESDTGGKAFRYGGEEFTILFPNKTQAEVVPLLEELRKAIAKDKHAYKKKAKDRAVTKKLGVTVSIGVAEKNEKFKTAEEVIQAADKALYRAKKNGRNCVSK